MEYRGSGGSDYMRTFISRCSVKYEKHCSLQSPKSGFRIDQGQDGGRRLAAEQPIGCLGFARGEQTVSRPRHDEGGLDFSVQVQMPVIDRDDFSARGRLPT